MMLHRAGNLFLANCSDVPIIHHNLLFATTFFVAIWSNPSTFYLFHCFLFFFFFLFPLFQTVDKTQVGSLPLSAFLSLLFSIHQRSSVSVAVDMDITLEMRSIAAKQAETISCPPPLAREWKDLGGLSSYRIKGLINSSQVVKPINTRQFALPSSFWDVCFVYSLKYGAFLKMPQWELQMLSCVFWKKKRNKKSIFNSSSRLLVISGNHFWVWNWSYAAYTPSWQAGDGKSK